MIKFIFILLFPLSLWSQKVYVTKYPSQADFKVLETQQRSQADLCVHKVKRPSEMGSDGLWYFVKRPSEADFIIYYTKYRSQANLVVDFVDYASYAGWVKKKKVFTNK